jgi:hypothetical protein
MERDARGDESTMTRKMAPILVLMPLLLAGCFRFSIGQVEVRVFNQSEIPGVISYSGSDGQGGGGAIAPCRETDFFLTRGMSELAIRVGTSSLKSAVSTPFLGVAYETFLIRPDGKIAHLDETGAASPAPAPTGC